MATTKRDINSPGVQIREIDLSTRAVAPNGTSVLVTGFAPQGPTAEIVNVSTLAEFQTIYGTPTNAAERYFYYSVNQIFQAGTNTQVNVARLPYGVGAGDGFNGNNSYTALLYPVVPVNTGSSNNTFALATSAGSTAIALSAATEYWITAPILISLNESDYNAVKQNNITWSSTGAGAGSAPGYSSISDIGRFGIIVLNEAKTTINEKFEGFYINVTDSTSFGPTTNYDSALSIYSINGASVYGNAPATQVPASTLTFSVSSAANSNIDSVSFAIENVPTFNISPGSGYEDEAVLSVVKVRTTPFANNSTALTYSLQEGYTGSLYANRTLQDPNGGAPITNFISNIINNAPANVSVYVNPNISTATGWLKDDGTALKKTKVLRTTTNGYGAANYLYAVGAYAPSLDSINYNTKLIGSVATKLDYILNVAENAEVYDLDIVVDAGLTTVAAVTGLYDDTLYSSTLQTTINTNLTDTSGNYSPFAGDAVDSWRTITNKFVDFAQFRRKDCVFISDPLRQILVQGENFKVLDDKSKNFSLNVYWPLRNSYNIYNSSYMAAYGNWGRTVDQYTGKPAWLPFSAFAAAIYSTNDAVAYPWGAPAGLNRGVVTGISDLAINPQQKQRDLLYKVSINPVVNFPNEGFVIMGQKTMLKTPSAFDRVNVRRLFLYLEKSVLATTKYFVFEPNTTFTRNRLVNTISPVFDLAKNTQGIYDYLIVCNDTNNTPDVIDDNSLVVDIYIKPVRTAEFILVNFYATRTSQNFQELLQ